jgi:hypothetical protein
MHWPAADEKPGGGTNAAAAAVNLIRSNEATILEAGPVGNGK